MDDHHHKNEEQQPLYAYDPLDDDDSTFKRAYAAATAFFVILGEWLILVVTCSIAMFFFPLTPGFTLHSASSSVLNVTNENHFTANFDVGLLVDDSNPVGSTIYYDSLHVSLFHHQEMLSTFLLHGSFQQNEPTKTAIEAKFPNVSVKVDEWGDVDHGVVEAHDGTTSCGFVYLDLWFSASARYTQPMWPSMWDKLQGHCGEVKVQMCSSGATNVVVQSFLASCDVYSDVVHKVRLVLFVLLILLLVTAVAVPLLVEQFFCSSSIFSS